ncbi:glycosyltransferase [Asticcacaulis sp. AC402]|uniref:glycosyltransferase n=1 Tax=Asticcacaulis sp. AC402 TaxID=1282361 RepID=UPI001F385FB7|nr:glycosyltransferase [Asticcacaulis sp. AC402]
MSTDTLATSSSVPVEPNAPDLSLIICTLNEGAAIRAVIEEICDTLAGISHEIIVVDDNSQDNTHAEVRAVAVMRPNVRLHVRVGERGLSSAAIKGWDIARGRFLGVMDGDGQHDPAAIRELAELILKGDKDLVCVSRYIGKTETGLSGLRDLGSKAFTWATGLVLKVPLSDPMSGCFMMTREYYQSARPKLTGIGFKILLDIAASTKVKPRFAEVKASLRQRQGGESKLDLRVVIDLVALLIEKATNGLLPARFVMFVGVGLSGVVVYTVVLIAAHLLFRSGDYLPIYRFRVLTDDLVSYSLAIWLSMTWNFFLNNILTFRDKRLHGWGLVRGLLGFYLACSIGALISLGLALLMRGQLNMHWLPAGVLAAVLSSVWNFWGATLLSWRTPKSK